ncbi:MAG: hypothetical protein HY908_06615 [Myxococcales bacterium]|nr:hypothetical protein [Myxococcales bacterium]
MKERGCPVTSPATLAAAILVAAVLSACTAAPDFKGYCAKAAPCEGKSVALCVEQARALHAQQRERGCGSEGAASLACATRHGRCETAGSWSLLMPTDACLGVIQALGDCLDRTRPASPAMPVEVEPPRPRSTASAAATSAPAAPSAAPAIILSVVDVADFGRRDVRTFAYAAASGQLFVSFSDRWSTEAALGDAVYQWDLTGEPRLAHTYRLEPGWIVDRLVAAPADTPGGLVVVGQYRSAGGSPFARHGLFDAERGRVVARGLEPFDERAAEVAWSPAGERVRLTRTTGPEPPGAPRAYDRTGAAVSADPAAFPARAPGRLSVVESTPVTQATRGLYYRAADGERHRITPDPWHDNFAESADGKLVATTTWDGELLAWSTEARRIVFRQKIASAYGYLAYDPRRDRFLLGDATGDGTTHLRALVRGR